MNSSEELIWRELNSQLLAGETVLRNVRFTDPRSGDVEADFLVFFPDAGVAVLEVKGGVVSYEEGEWVTRTRRYSRRIHPIEQARKAKHALRRFLDRQPEWHHGLIRSDWFVALPFTQIEGDMGPEGRREHLIGQSDLGTLRVRLRNQLLNPLNKDLLASTDWVDEAVSLVLRLNANSVATPTRNLGLPLRITSACGLGVIAALISGLITIRGGWLGITAFSFVTVLSFFVVVRVFHERNRDSKLPWALMAASVFGILLGFIIVIGVFGDEVVEGNCSPDYVPCIPIEDDMTCSDIRVAVRVIGTDVYQLDRNGDGIGCESYK